MFVQCCCFGRSFIHRCGRTARMGRRGSALVFLLPSETAYIQYMGISQKVELQPLPLDDDLVRGSQCVNSVQDLLCRERLVGDKIIIMYIPVLRVLCLIVRSQSQTYVHVHMILHYK